MKQLSVFHIFPVKIVNKNWKQLNSQMVTCISSYSIQRNICKGCTVTSTAWGQTTAIVIVCSNAHKSFRVVSKSGNHSFTVHQSVTALILHTTNHSTFSHIMFSAPLHEAASYMQWKAFTSNILVHSTFVSRSNNPLLATDNNVPEENCILSHKLIMATPYTYFFQRLSVNLYISTGTFTE